MIPTIIAIIVIVLAVGGAAAYVIHAKKSGKKCIGCPYEKSCSSQKTAKSEKETCGCCKKD